MSTDARTNAHRAAALVQRRWRRGKQHIFLIESLRRLYSQPDIEKAKKHAESFLPKDRLGNLYPLAAPFKVSVASGQTWSRLARLSHRASPLVTPHLPLYAGPFCVSRVQAFHSMGCGVALYMYTIHWWACLFFVLSLITMGLTFLYLEGNGLSVVNRNIYTVHALGNYGTYHNATAHFEAKAAGKNVTASESEVPGSGSPELPASFGAVEILVALILVWFTYWQNAKVRLNSRKICRPTQRQPTTRCSSAASHLRRAQRLSL